MYQKWLRRARAIFLANVMGVTLLTSATLASGQKLNKEPVSGLVEQISQTEGLQSGLGYAKVSSILQSVLAEFRSRGITRENALARGAAALSNPLVHVDADGAVQIYFHMLSFGEAELATLVEHEVVIQIANEKLGIVQAWIPFDRVDDLAALPFVVRITTPSYGRSRSGSVTTEGDSILKADQLRALGFDGSGVKVGIISDGANNWTQSQATGDLPASGITLFGSCTPRARNISICDPGLTCNEGTAMAEIVHDIAPGRRSRSAPA